MSTERGANHGTTEPQADFPWQAHSDRVPLHQNPQNIDVEAASVESPRVPAQAGGQADKGAGKRHVSYARSPSVDSACVDLERGDRNTAAINAIKNTRPGLFGASQPSHTNSAFSEKPTAEHAEYADGHNARPNVFSRTFTEQFRTAHVSSADFQNLSQRDKRAVVTKGLRSYFMDTNIKNRKEPPDQDPPSPSPPLLPKTLSGC